MVTFIKLVFMIGLICQIQSRRCEAWRVILKLSVDILEVKIFLSRLSIIHIVVGLEYDPKPNPLTLILILIPNFDPNLKGCWMRMRGIF